MTDFSSPEEEAQAEWDYFHAEDDDPDEQRLGWRTW